MKKLWVAFASEESAKATLSNARRHAVLADIIREGSPFPCGNFFMAVSQ